MKLPPLEWLVDSILNRLEIESEAAEIRLREELSPYAQALSALERMTDLVRYQRGELFSEGLITHEEFAALVADSEGGKRVARLEGYDAMRLALEKLK